MTAPTRCRPAVCWPVVLATVAVAGCGSIQAPGAVTHGGQPTGVSAELPTDNDLRNRNSFSCSALLETDMTGSTDSLRPRGLEGKVAPGTNNIAVSISDTGTLSFLSQAGFSAGTTRGSEFVVHKNDADELVESYYDGQSYNSFVLNRKNGFAIWSKIRATFIGYEAPTGAQTYLACK